MSRIAHLKSAGMKAHDFDSDLAPLTILIGPVGSGKSTALEAIRFGASGHCPALGKSEASTARLMRGDEMSVEVHLDDGRRFLREMRRSAGKISQDLVCSWLPPQAKRTEIDQAIGRLFGASDQETEEHLDLRELLQCTPNERARRIEKLLDASGIPVDRLVRRGCALLFLRAGDAKVIPDELEKASEAAFGIRATIDGPKLAALEVVARDFAQLLHESLSSAEERMSLAHKDCAKDAGQKKAALEEISQREATLRAPKEAIEDLTRRRDEAMATAAKAKRDIETWAASVSAKRSSEQALPALRQQVADNLAKLQNVTATVERVAELRKQADAIVDPPDVVPPTAVIPDAAAIAEADTLAAQADTIEAEVRALTVPSPIFVMLEEAAAAEASRQHARALESPWREVEEIAARMNDVKANKDQIVAAVKAWPELTEFAVVVSASVSRLLNLAKKHGGDAAELEHARHKAYEALADAQRASAARDVDIRAIKDGISAGLLNASELRSKAAEIRRAATGGAEKTNGEAQRAYWEASRARTTAVDNNRRQRQGLLAEASQLEQGTSAAQAAMDKAKSELGAIEARLAGIQDVIADPEAAQKTVVEAEALLQELDAKIKACRDADARASEMRELKRELDKAIAFSEAYSCAVWSCQKLRKEDLAARAKGIEARMRVFLRAAGRSEEPYIRADRGAVDFGWRNGAAEISVEALSGGETVLFVAAMASAVIAMRAPAVKVLLIEGAELGAGGFAEAMFKGCEAIASDLDNVVICTNAQITARPGWKVIRVADAENAPAHAA